MLLSAGTRVGKEFASQRCMWRRKRSSVRGTLTILPKKYWICLKGDRWKCLHKGLHIKEITHVEKFHKRSCKDTAWVKECAEELEQLSMGGKNRGIASHGRGLLCRRHWWWIVWRSCNMQNKAMHARESDDGLCIWDRPSISHDVSNTMLRLMGKINRVSYTRYYPLTVFFID